MLISDIRTGVSLSGGLLAGGVTGMQHAVMGKTWGAELTGVGFKPWLSIHQPSDYPQGA